MSEPIEPIHHKLAEAIPPAPDDIPVEHDLPDTPAEIKSDMKENNARAQPDRKDRLVDIGRGEHTKGRGPQ